MHVLKFFDDSDHFSPDIRGILGRPTWRFPIRNGPALEHLVEQLLGVIVVTVVLRRERGRW